MQKADNKYLFLFQVQNVYNLVLKMIKEYNTTDKLEHRLQVQKSQLINPSANSSRSTNNILTTDIIVLETFFRFDEFLTRQIIFDYFFRALNPARTVTKG